MSQDKPLVLKLGGSVLTDKNTELEVQMQTVNRLAEEIMEASPEKLIIVHGGGSFGHPTAQKYSIKEGFREKSQKIGFAETHHVMTILNGLLMDALIWRGIPAISITPSSCMTTCNGRIKSFEYNILKQLLNMGFIPVLYGDAVLDEELGFTILSGDQLTAYLATLFNAEKIIVGVDVDGIFDADPKYSSKARMFEHLTLEELRNVQKMAGCSSGIDVTGGMSTKINELIKAVEQGIQVLIVNAAKPKNIYKALKGEEVKGTLIKKE